MDNQSSELSASYDRVAEEFVEEFCKELERKPFDRELLTRFAEIESIVVRDPYDFEYPTPRIYALSNKPSQAK